MFLTISGPKVLLCSVFGPYCQDDEYGSRELNPMELYHNQVTRVQGAFSLRMFHRSWGLMMIQANIHNPCVVLDFPTLDRFIEEIKNNKYDIIGISSIIPNIHKVKKMCELIREISPNTQIVIGGHIANVPNLNEKISADIIVKGDGIRAMRNLLGEDENQPINHPFIISGFGIRSCGMLLAEKPEEIAATIIPSVGCPLGCNFCSTSAMFGGKGHSVDFYSTGEDLFTIMEKIEKGMSVRSFFVMDENFLLNQKRALRLLELMEEHKKAWTFYVFTSANVLKKYTIDQLIRLGVSWIWMGLEGEKSQYQKLSGIDTFDLVNTLQSNGIHILGSTIIGLENHTPDNINQVIEYAIKHNTDFHQFMLYTPIPGTPLYTELTNKGLMKPEDTYNMADIHGQLILNYRHPSFNDEQTAEFMLKAFNRDFEVNGPSIVRIVKTTLAGCRKYKNHPDLRVRSRVLWESRNLSVKFSALVGATRLYFKKNPAMHKKMSELLQDLHTEFGWKSRFSSFFGGRWLLRKIRKEEDWLVLGGTYEPQTFYERNKYLDNPNIYCCQSVAVK